MEALGTSLARARPLPDVPLLRDAGALPLKDASSEALG